MSGPGRRTRHGAVTSQSFRLVTALFGHAGIEQDLTGCSGEELAALAAWTRLYREFRPLLHDGRVVRGDVGDEATLLHGVVAARRDGGPVLLGAAGDLSRRAIRPRAPPRPGRGPSTTGYGSGAMPAYPTMHQTTPPAWLTQALDGWVAVPGAVLSRAGLPMPVLNPEQAMLIEVRATET